MLLLIYPLIDLASVVEQTWIRRHW